MSDNLPKNEKIEEYANEIGVPLKELQSAVETFIEVGVLPTEEGREELRAQQDRVLADIAEANHIKPEHILRAFELVSGDWCEDGEGGALQRDAEYSHKLFLVFAEGSEEVKAAVRTTIDAWLDMVRKDKGGAR